MKKSFVSIFIALMLLVFGTSVTFAAQPAAEKQLPLAGSEVQLLFKGSFQADENDVVDWPTIYVHGIGSGNATILGLYSVRFDGVVENGANGIGYATLTARFVAANGDIIFAEATGVGGPTETPGINRIVEEYTITGGTGRFADATGSFIVERWLTLATGVSSGTIKGYIILP